MVSQALVRQFIFGYKQLSNNNNVSSCFWFTERIDYELHTNLIPYSELAAVLVPSTIISVILIMNAVGAAVTICCLCAYWKRKDSKDSKDLTGEDSIDGNSFQMTSHLVSVHVCIL